MPDQHQCTQNKRFFALAEFTGEVRAGIKSIQEDIHAVFEKFRLLEEGISALKTEWNTEKTKTAVELSSIKLKFSIYGGLAFMVMQVGMIFIKKYWG